MSGLLYSVVLRLRPLDEAGPARATGYQTYGLILRLIAAADPTLAETLHSDRPRKPLTVSELLPATRSRGGVRSTLADCFLIRVTLLQDAVFGALARGVLDHPPNQPVMVGDAAYGLEGLATHPGESPWAGTSSFEALAEEGGKFSGRITFKLISPAVFRSRGSRNVLFPEPGLVFGSLFDKWNAFCPAESRLSLDKATLSDRLVVDAFRLATRRVDFGSYAETGVQGWCGYRLAAGLAPAERSAVGSLAAFATFAGIGAKTTMGLGQVLVPSE